MRRLIRPGAGPPGPAPTAPSPRVVILGGGFAGLYAAKRLNGTAASVTLVDRLNYHLFQPLLYQVATAGLSPGDIAQPIRHLFAGSPNIAVLLARATAIEVPNRTVVLDDGRLPYDYLVVATGARHSYFGRDDWAALAPGLKDLDDALEIRRRVLLSFERAERETDAARRQALLNFVIVGGGPTGVELAGALIELTRDALSKEFRSIDRADARSVLLERGPRLLAGFDESLGEFTARRLRGLGVDVRTDSALVDMAPGFVNVAGQVLPAETVLWAAGVRASALGHTLGIPTDSAGRVHVMPDLSIPGHPDVFVVGDLAALRRPDGRLLPGMAPVAIQMGRHAADNILRLASGAPARPFHYRDRGMMATIGRHAAVGHTKHATLDGGLAWFAWLFAHITFLVGFRNRILVLVEWAWAYLPFNRGVRLITGRGAEAPVDGADRDDAGGTSMTGMRRDTGPAR